MGMDYVIIIHNPGKLENSPGIVRRIKRAACGETINLAACLFQILHEIRLDSVKKSYVYAMAFFPEPAS